MNAHPARMSVAAALFLATQLILVTAPAAAQSPSPSPADPDVTVATPSAVATEASPSPDATTDVALVDFAIEPAVIEVSAAQWTFAVANGGITPHNFSVRDAAGVLTAATPTLSQGETAIVTIELDEDGSYTFFCSLPGHESLGMSGQLVWMADEPSPTPTGS